MKINVELKSIHAEVKLNTLVIRSDSPLNVLSSAVLGGGLTQARGIINVQVPEGSGKNKNDVHWNAEQFLKDHSERLGFSKEEVVGLMTAAKMKNLAMASRKFDDGGLTVFVTAGVTVAVTAGEATISKKSSSGGHKFGTINIILIVDGNLTGSSLVEAHKTVTEAKTVALRELDVRSQFSSDLATGTLTDSVVVACTGQGKPIAFAGTYTIIGELIGECVRECVKSAILKQENVAGNRPLQERLEERGIRSREILSLNYGASIRRPMQEQLKKELELALTDRKLASLILAALRFDEDLSKGLIPEGLVTVVDEKVFERILTDAFKNYLAHDEKEKHQQSLGSFGPLTGCVFEAISKNISSKMSGNCVGQKKQKKGSQDSRGKRVLKKS